MMNIYPQKMPAREWDFGLQGKKAAGCLSTVFLRYFLGILSVFTQCSGGMYKRGGRALTVVNSLFNHLKLKFS